MAQKFGHWEGNGFLGYVQVKGDFILDLGFSGLCLGFFAKGIILNLNIVKLESIVLRVHMVVCSKLFFSNKLTGLTGFIVYPYL
jgi:hypothetical protein